MHARLSPQVLAANSNAIASSVPVARSFKITLYLQLMSGEAQMEKKRRRGLDK